MCNLKHESNPSISRHEFPIISLQAVKRETLGNNASGSRGFLALFPHSSRISLPLISIMTCIGGGMLVVARGGFADVRINYGQVSHSH